MSKTLNAFRRYIALGNVFCINRNYLIENSKQRIGCNFIFIVATIGVICALFYDIISSIDTNLYAKVFHLLLVAEVALLSFEAINKRASFEVIKRLDEKCHLNDEDYNEKIKDEVNKITALSIASIMIDVIGLFILETEATVMFILVTVFAAHDSELSFYSTIIETINIRLENLKEVNINYGSKVYRHVLIASLHFNREFSLRIFIMLGLTIITTVLYSVTVVLVYDESKIKLIMYLVWRELRSLYLVWLISYAAARTETICNELGFHLAKRLTFDSSVKKEINPTQNKILKRWCNIVLNLRPRFVNTWVLSIGLALPINLIDISINYVLIVLQLYIAYK